MSVRVRFAPSPTGYLHVGGLRTALYNFLFARHHGGVNVLRIEDTDQTRLVEGAAQNFIEVCRWAGIEFDESPEKGGPFGPYVQSERTEIYRGHAQKLLDSGAAYYAFDTAEELEAMRERMNKAGVAAKYDRSIMRNQFTLGEEETRKLIAEGCPKVIRLKMPLSGEIRFGDIVRGDIIVPARDVDDSVLLKSDGFPTYHLANVVDDHLMGITHVIRGEEWLPSTPKHVLLYQGFGWQPPEFAHLPLLLNPDKSKLSKRQGDVAVEDYRAKGFFNDALVNFLALLGWNPTADREIFSIDEMIAMFDLKKVNKAGAVFDVKKLEWMNATYLRSKSSDELGAILLPMLEERGITGISADYAGKVAVLLRERVTLLNEIPEFGDYMFAEPAEFDAAYRTKHRVADTSSLLSDFVLHLPQEWTLQNIRGYAHKYLEEKGLALKNIIHPLRHAITGKSVGAGLFETMELLGREKCVQRIKAQIPD